MTKAHQGWRVWPRLCGKLVAKERLEAQVLTQRSQLFHRWSSYGQQTRQIHVARPHPTWQNIHVCLSRRLMGSQSSEGSQSLDPKVSSCLMLCSLLSPCRVPGFRISNLLALTGLGRLVSSHHPYTQPLVCQAALMPVIKLGVTYGRKCTKK